MSDKNRVIETLDKRLEFMLDIDLPKSSTNNEKLRIALNEALKENELMKK